MDTGALVAIVVSGAVGATALWIGAGWLRESARARHQWVRRPPPSVQRSPSTPRTATPRMPAAAAPAQPPALPLLDDELSPPMTGSDTAWPTTNFPTTQPMRDSELPDVGTPFAFAETQPMPLLPEPR